MPETLQTRRPVQPIDILRQHIHEWGERRISPQTVVQALGHLANRPLEPHEEHDTIALMNDRIIGSPKRRGES